METIEYKIEMLKMFDAVVEGVFSKKNYFSQNELEICLDDLYHNQKKILLYLLMKSINSEKLSDITDSDEKEFLQLSVDRFLNSMTNLIGWVELTNMAADYQEKKEIK